MKTLCTFIGSWNLREAVFHAFKRGDNVAVAVEELVQELPDGARETIYRGEAVLGPTVMQCLNKEKGHLP